MKLRNKKTGEIVEAESWTSTDGMFVIFYESKDGQLGSMESFESLTELNEEWEDYNPAEPLIKDEKIRKAVRAWAEANEVFGASTYKSCSDGHYWYIRAFNDTERGIDIDLWGDLPKELIDCKYYTIAELCGEEE